MECACIVHTPKSPCGAFTSLDIVRHLSGLNVVDIPRKRAAPATGRPFPEIAEVGRLGLPPYGFNNQGLP